VSVELFACQTREHQGHFIDTGLNVTEAWVAPGAAAAAPGRAASGRTVTHQLVCQANALAKSYWAPGLLSHERTEEVPVAGDQADPLCRGGGRGLRGGEGGGDIRADKSGKKKT